MGLQSSALGRGSVRRSAGLQSLPEGHGLSSNRSRADSLTGEVGVGGRQQGVEGTAES